MVRDPASVADEVAVRGALRLTRGITATWWYTFTAIMFFEIMLVAVWVGTLFGGGFAALPVQIVTFGGLLWFASTIPLLLDYRHRTGGVIFARWRRLVVPLTIAVAFGVAAGISTGIWLIAVLPVVQSLSLLDWQPGVRLRAVMAGTVLLGALWVVDASGAFAGAADLDGGASWWLLGFYSTSLPAMTVVSLWWWDVLVTLDRARASEARLAATQERLRVATDVHDLQGHHLQVIALQLELAERLMSRDPDAALEQLRAGRASVDEARQGTRDLALQFRSVPLRDELANAVDLLRAAGITADATVDRDVARAPANVLGPVIRETTTNVLRQSAGSWARLALERTANGWRYEISNDSDGEASASTDGAGLEGIARRAEEAGGSLDIRREKQTFALSVTVPDQQEGAP
ncbi:histidine kinase [Microbacterium lacus]|uniref:sensor histidine kinase n=1 Tax=Microbacterium lacus TaxID=415217 RepID=UPI00384C2534